MPLANTYSAGKITVTKNSVNFTGTGTLWKSAGLRDGDFIIVNDAIGIIQGDNTFGQPITSNTSGKFKRPWQGTSGTYDYDAIFRSVDSRLTSNTQQVLETIASGLVEAFGKLPAENNKMPYLTGVNSVGLTDLKDWARTLLAAANGGKGYEALGGIPNGQLPTRLRVDGGAQFGDPNLITESGWYRIGGSNPNMPEGATMLLFHLAYTSSQARQIAMRHSDNSMYERCNVSGTWSPWYRMYSANNLLANVSQSNGVPTGGVIQRGSNANGEFVRFADGTQICWKNAIEATNGTSQYTINNSWSFPAAFSSNLDAVSGTCAFADPNNVLQPSNDGIRTASPYFRNNSPSTASVGVMGVNFPPDSKAWVRVTAIGRWF